MKALITISTLVVAASPLSAIILQTTLNVTSFDVLTAGPIGNTFVTSGLAAGTNVAAAFTVGTNGKRVNAPTLANGAPVGVSGQSPTIFSTFTFSVTAPGAYTFVSTFGDNAIDGFLSLYTSSYDPANPLTNVISANNDNTSQNVSSLELTLATGVNYVLVNTLANGSFFPNGIGFATAFPSRSNALVINGPGELNVNEVPFGVDSTLGLAVLGAVGALRLRRRRNA